MRLRGILFLMVAACGESSGDDAPPVVTCQIDDDCGGMYCAAGTCGARPQWTAAAPVGGGVASPGADQPGATVGVDNLEIIFSSNRPGGMGCGDLWRATRASLDAAFGTAEVLTALNTADCEGFPTLRGDGLEMLFMRNRQTPLLSVIMRSTRASIGDPFEPPVEVAELSIDDFVGAPSLTADGLLVVFQVGTPGQSLIMYQAERTSVTEPFAAPQAETAVFAGLGIGIDPDGLYALGTQTSPLDRLAVFTRNSRTTPFMFAGLVTELTANPAFPVIGSPSVSSDGNSLYFVRRSDDNHVEIWSAQRE